MDEPSRGHRKAIAQIHVNGDDISCGLEEAKVLVFRLKGVLNVESNHVSETLVIEYDPDKVTLDQIRETIKNRRKAQSST